MNAKILIKEIHLTKLEKSVLEGLYRTTLPNSEIAEINGISLASIKFHSHNIYTKLKVANRLQLKALDRKFITSLIK